MGRVSLAALLLAGGAVIHGATAQEGIAPSRISATISQSLEADTNYDLENDSPGTAYFGDTRLEIGLLRETQTQSFALGLDTALRALDRADEPFEFTLGSPTGGLLDYAVEGPNAEFDTLLQLPADPHRFPGRSRRFRHRRGVAARRPDHGRSRERHPRRALRRGDRRHLGHRIAQQLHAALLRHRYRLFRRRHRPGAAPLRPGHRGLDPAHQPGALDHRGGRILPVRRRQRRRHRPAHLRDRRRPGLRARREPAAARRHRLCRPGAHGDRGRRGGHARRIPARPCAATCSGSATISDWWAMHG